MKSRDFLLEINFEEMPAGYLMPVLDKLPQLFFEEFDKQGISYNRDVFLGGTKNLLILYIKDVSVKQEKSPEKVWGPPKSIAIDKDGNFTKEALGFAKRQDIKIEDLKFERTNKGEYTVVEKKVELKNTKDVLLKLTPQIIKNMYFPKTMRWDTSDVRFARPIESVLVLFGKEKLCIKLGNVPQKKISSIAPTDYLKCIQKRYLIEPDKRKERIKRSILDSMKKIGADLDVDENLLEEVNFMVTYPDVFTGEFNKDFLALPEEVLKASMSKYQRVFPVSKKGHLINKFIAIIDGDGRDIKSVRKIYEKILEARLQDSLFFFNEDTKEPFSENIPHLKDLIFQNDLGNMFEKIDRLQKLCVFICDKLNVNGSLKIDIQRAAELSKADLVTHMVGEFPSLQGVMGREYALKSGEKKEVSVAIREHYLPQGVDDMLPQTLQGAILAISDRIDNIVGFLGIAVEISGSFDPFGIRRNTIGLIQIIRDKSMRFKVDELIEEAIQRYGGKLELSPIELKDKIIDYIKERIEFLSGSLEVGLKEAVLEVKCFDIVDIFNRISMFSSISKERYFLEAAKVVERTSNILKGAKGEKIGDVNESLFSEELERELWKRYLWAKNRVRQLIDEEKYKEATKVYGESFFKILNDFFDKILVNVEDRIVRLNRLAIMKAINELYTERVADLAKLPQIVVK